ncbi:DUF5652 family protein [Pelotomaculum propionicicum]|uniref:DUF5652 family protein n=1 Tax=Pelotomaculum propionicicum TaxID=258475 RepID=UPI003B7ED4F9
MNTDAVVQYFQSNPWMFTALVAWSIIWKALALWHAARNSQLAWYIVLIIINTAGILEIIYLLFFRRKRSRF